MPHSKTSNDTLPAPLGDSPIVQVASFWSWLPAFRVVAETRHLPTASERLGVSASALSRSVKLLEGALGVELFRRVGARLEITESGDALLLAVRNGMRAIHDGMLAARDETLRGVIRVSSSGAATTIAVVPALLDLRNRHPGLQGIVVHEIQEPESTALLNGRLDLVIRGTPIEHEGLESKCLGSLSHGVFCGPGHALYEGAPIDSVKDLRDHEFVSPGTDESGRNVDGWPDALERQVGIQVDQMRVGAEVCADGRMLAVLPDALVERRNLPLRRLDLDVIPDATVFATTRVRLGTPDRVHTLVDAIAERL